MTTYDLYLESGPKRRKTMVHVPELLGCMANGPTTDEAVAATPAAIAAYRHFLSRHGEDSDLDEPIQTRIAQHLTEGDWLGNGSPYILFETDFEPLNRAEIELYLNRFHGLTEELVIWLDEQDDAALDAESAAGGRTGRRIIQHVLGASGGYLSAALGGAPGFGKISGAAERGELSLADALRQVDVLAAERLRATTPEDWTRVRILPNSRRTLRQAIRRMLEHHWEHLAELSRRPGGPPLCGMRQRD